MEKKKRANYKENFEEFSEKTNSGPRKGNDKKPGSTIEKNSLENSTVVSNQTKKTLLEGQKNPVKETGNQNRVVGENTKAPKKVQRTPEKIKQTYSNAQEPNSGKAEFKKEYDDLKVASNVNLNKRTGLLDLAKDKIESVSNGIHKVKKGLDAVFSDNYKDYKVNTNGKESLKQFSDNELKYLNRDYKINNKDNTEIKTELKERKIDFKAISDSAKVQPIYNLNTDKGKISLGVDKTNGDIKISTNDYKNNPNIKTWKTLENDDLSKALIGQGNIKELSMENKLNSTNRPDISNANIDKLQEIVNNGISNSQAKNLVKDINSETLKNPMELKGQIVRTTENDKTELYKVLNADKDNLTVQKVTGLDNNAYLANVKTEKENALNRDVQVMGVIDSKTVIGHNHSNNETYMGTVNNDKSVNWEAKPDFLNKLSDEKREKVENKLETGDYRLANITAVGRIEGGNILYAAEKGNKDVVLTGNQKDWVNANGKVGEALMSLSGGLDINNIKTMMKENASNSNSMGQQTGERSFSPQNNAPERSNNQAKNISTSLSR